MEIRVIRQNVKMNLFVKTYLISNNFGKEVKSNMKSFMIHITLPDSFSPRFYELIPQQRSKMKELMDNNIILSYSLDMERKNIWILLEAKNEIAVYELLKTFPLIQLVEAEVHELAFIDKAHIALPELNLN
jgi:hypothetical protein